MSGVTVQLLWGIYIASVVILSILMCFILAKSPGIGCSIGVFVSTILAALIVYLVTIYNIDPATLSPGEQSSLAALNITMLVLIVLAFFFCIIELAMKGGRHAKGTHTHVDAVCDSKTGTCDVKKVKICSRNDEGVSVVNMACNDGNCSPTDLLLRDKNGNVVNVSYLS